MFADDRPVPARDWPLRDTDVHLGGFPGEPSYVLIASPIIF